MKKNEKICAILNGLIEFHQENGKKVIIRLELRRLISGKLNIVHQATVSGWINRLLGQGFIELNPTSETIRVESNPYNRSRGLYPNTKMRMPNNETRYIINIEKIKQRIETRQTTLM